MIFFKWNLEWPSDVQIMYTKLSQGQFICVLSISKLRMTISHEELAKIDIYGQNTSNDPLCPVSNRPTQLLATYISSWFAFPSYPLGGGHFHEKQRFYQTSEALREASKKDMNMRSIVGMFFQMSFVHSKKLWSEEKANFLEWESG